VRLFTLFSPPESSAPDRKIEFLLTYNVAAQVL
jgi:hypothetical protein